MEEKVDTKITETKGNTIRTTNAVYGTMDYSTGETPSSKSFLKVI